MTTNTHVIRPEIDDPTILNETEQTRYQSGVGSLLYIINHSRQDLSNSVHELTKSMDLSNTTNYKQLLKVIKFLQLTKQLCICINTIHASQWTLQ